MRNFVVHGGVSGIKSGEGVANQVLVTKAGEEPRFGLSAEDLNLDLGPAGKLM